MTALVWRSALDAQDAADVLALLDAAIAADGTAPVSEHVLLHLRRGGDPLAQHLLVRESDMPDSPLTGYAHLDLTDPVAGGSGELAVHPDARGHGVGSQLVSELLARTAAHQHAGRLRLWAHGEHPGAVRLADKMGFRQVRTLWQMRRSLLAPLGAPDGEDRSAELPEGVRLRPFVVGQDESEFLRVNNAAFDWHPEQGGWDVEQVKLREAEPWFDPAGFLLAVEPDGHGGERLLGFHWTKVHGGPPDQHGGPPDQHGGPPNQHGGTPDQHGAPGTEHHHDPIGEVYVLGVDPAARGRRLGQGLTLAGLRYLRGLGLREVMLYVEAENDAAVAVYRNLGFTHWDTDVAYLH